MTKQLNDFKEDLIKEIRMREEDKVIEPSKAELLTRLIRNAETEMDALTIAEMGTIYRKTGFYYDVRPEKQSDTIKYLKKNEKLSFKSGDGSGLTHKLIIGDNYDALRQLLITHEGTIDVIYIDPPYGCNSMGEFADTNYENQITRDNLLSMLYSRLKIARKLLNEDGIIFVSIDDKNLSHIKLLMDDTFGENNFMSCIARECIKGGTKTKNIKSVNDYVLVYAKELRDGGDIKTLLLGEEFEETYTKEFSDEVGIYYKGRELNKWGAGSRREDSPSMWFPIPGPDGEDVYPIRNDGSEGRWRWGKQKLLNAVKNNDVLFEKRKDGGYIVYEKIRKISKKNHQLTSILTDDYINAKGGEEIKSIFNTLMSEFNYAKPVSLIEELISYLPSSDVTVLDFFAGSGTTGQAVLRLNQKDNGNRQYICCTLNEVTKTTPNGIAYDITSKRLKRIMTGECYDGTKDFKWLEKNQPYGDNLDVYEIESVSNKAVRKGKTPFDLIDETNYDLPKFNTEEEKIKWICENFEQTEKYISEEE